MTEHGWTETVEVPAGMEESEAARAARMAWWREAKFGLFIHWGVYAVPAGVYQGKPVDRTNEWLMGDGPWIMRDAHIPIAEYRTYADGFSPDAFDADACVRLATEAGMKYVVMTSKHHDGFAMYPSRVSPWNIRDAAGWPRDPLRELAEACRKYGLKLGFYYSQAQDWVNGGAVWENEKWDPGQDRDMDDYIEQVAVPQVRELCSNYAPAILWWDTPTDMNRARAEKLHRAAKAILPDIITNNRLGGDMPGDTETPEQVIPATGFPGRDWETCMTINDTWGYKSHDHNWKSAETLIRNLCDIVSKGGNFLLNVGPDREGVIPPPSVERLRGIGAWMKINAEAIHGTTASPFEEMEWGRCTVKARPGGVVLYLHVFTWPADGRLRLPGLRNRPVSARLLMGPQPLAVQSTAAGVELALPETAPDPIVSVIRLEVEGGRVEC